LTALTNSFLKKRDTVFDVLHTSKQGIGSTSINNTIQFLRKRGLYPQFQEFLQTFNYSGLSDKFAANLGNLSTFSGKELGQLVEIFPIALLHLRAPREWVTAWSLVSEIIVDDYCWSPLRDQLEHRKIMVRFFLSFSFPFPFPFSLFFFLCFFQSNNNQRPINTDKARENLEEGRGDISQAAQQI